jgi:hypothetical protein
MVGSTDLNLTAAAGTNQFLYVLELLQSHLYVLTLSKCQQHIYYTFALI